MKKGYCAYCGIELTECKFGKTPKDRLGCDNDNCPE